MSRIVANPLALPAFSILAAAVFMTVHLTSGQWKESPVLATPGGSMDTGRENVGGGGLLVDNAGIKPFTYTPTMAPNTDTQFVPVPTVLVVAHNVPQITDLEPTTGTYLNWNTIPLGQPTP
jgi:hypothetical protein